MNIFINTFLVTCGILLPFVVIVTVFAIYIIIRNYLAYQTAKAERDAEKWKKQAPFDDEAEFYEVPNPTMVGVRLKKNGETVWEGGIDKRGINL